MTYYQNGDGIHVGDPLGDDFTLCRDACEGEEPEIGKMKTVAPQKITCPRCLEIIRFCCEEAAESEKTLTDYVVAKCC